MLWHLELLSFVLGINSIVADNSVQFLSKPFGQLSTSSTLRWIHAENGMVPPNAVIGATRFNQTDGQRNIYICRALHLAEWIPGQLISENKSCIISLLGNVNSYKVYEVLQNVDNGSRLSWANWDFFHPPLSGMVAGSSNFYIARKKIAGQEDNEVSSHIEGNLKSRRGYSHYVGKFNPQYRYGRIFVITEDNEERDFSSGEILTETEPINYELNNVTFNMARKKVRRERRILATTILRNTVNVKMEVDSILEYNFTYTSYWGQGSAILTGLRTLIRNNTGKILGEIKWGTEENEQKRDIFRVSMNLQPNTAVNITLYGNETKSEIPYTGTLISFYKDGYKMERNVEGTRRMLEMKDIKPVFGPIYFIHNNSLVPTTTSTTTTTTTTTTSRTINTDYIIGDEAALNIRKNNSIAKTSLQANDMLSDDGAISLESKNQEEKSEFIDNVKQKNNATSVRTSFTFLVVFSILFSMCALQK